MFRDGKRDRRQEDLLRSYLGGADKRWRVSEKAEGQWEWEKGKVSDVTEVESTGLEALWLSFGLWNVGGSDKPLQDLVFQASQVTFPFSFFSEAAVELVPDCVATQWKATRYMSQDAEESHLTSTGLWHALYVLFVMAA